MCSPPCLRRGNSNSPLEGSIRRLAEEGCYRRNNSNIYKKRKDHTLRPGSAGTPPSREEDRYYALISSLLIELDMTNLKRVNINREALKSGEENE